LRTGGVSAGAFANLNLATHVGDVAAAVAENRRRLQAALDLNAAPLWLDQVHGVGVAAADARGSLVGNCTDVPQADASVCAGPGRACVVLTADCLPVLFCDREGTRVGAAHAGWRGLAGGVLGAAVAALDASPDQLMAWLGPAIEQSAFEVGPEVRDQFLARNAGAAAAFVINARGRWQADLYALARLELASLGIQRVYGGTHRCFADAARFFSYRRDGQTGRMATMIWLAR
jgi:YfiH family protein